MRKQIVTGLAAVAVLASTSFAAMAGGVAAPIIEPTVFVEPEADGSMGSLGGVAPLLLGALLIGAIVIASDDSSGD